MAQSHLLILAVFSALVSFFFAGLTRDRLGEGLRLAGLMFVSMVGISLVLAYLMYLFPLD